jgi:microcystin-dependent protein
MNFLTKMNFTYVIIIVIIIMASIHLYKLKSTENFEDIPIYKNQVIGNSVQILIPTMNQVKFGGNGLDTILNDKVSKNDLNDAMPELSIISYFSSTAPNGWQLCDGANLEYKDSNPYKFFLDNTGNPIKTPDLRGRFILGSNPVKINGTTPNFDRNIRNLNENGGEETHKLSEGEMPIHNHGMGLGAAGGGTGAQTWVDLGGWHHGFHAFNMNTGNKGGDVAHNNMPPFYVLTYIIKKPSQPSQFLQS